MKKLVLLLIILSFFSLYSEQAKVKLAVMDISDENELFTPKELENAAEYLRGKLASSGKFLVIAKERQKKSKTKMMKKESYKVCYDKSCQIPLGQSLSADTILTGKITFLLGQYTLTVELIDLAKEATVKAASFDFREKGEFLKVLSDAVKKLKNEERFVEKSPEKKITVSLAAEDKKETKKTPKKEKPVKLTDSYKSEINEVENRELEIEQVWKEIKELLMNENISNEKKIEMLSEFISKYPENNKYIKEVKLIKKELVKNRKTFKKRDIYDLMNKNNYRTGTEWVSGSFVIGNYGFGGSITFFTIRWKYFYWDILSFTGQQIADYFSEDTMLSLIFKTTFGFPIFLTSDNRNELRIGTGFSGGLSNKSLPEYDSGDYAHLHSYINIPLKLSYVHHIFRHFSFEVGVTLDLPVFFSETKGRNYDGKGIGYTPVFNGLIGFRF